jgi:hypothetical protein
MSLRLIEKIQTDSNIESKLEGLLSTQPIVRLLADKQTVLGTTKVVLLNKNEELTALHTSTVNLLEQNGAVFNTPQYTRTGFVPHCTIQKTERLNMGERVILTTVALVDMFPKGNWQQRRVISTFTLQPRSIK